MLYYKSEAAVLIKSQIEFCDLKLVGGPRMMAMQTLNNLDSSQVIL